MSAIGRKQTFARLKGTRLERSDSPVHGEQYPLSDRRRAGPDDGDGDRGRRRRDRGQVASCDRPDRAAADLEARLDKLAYRPLRTDQERDVIGQAAEIVRAQHPYIAGDRSAR